VVREHFEELRREFPRLLLFESATGRWVIEGLFAFSASFNDELIADAFELQLLLPISYPNHPPVVQEKGGRIPREFHTNPDSTLCLGAPLAVYLKHRAGPRLLPFVEEQVIHFLFAFRYWELHGEFPFGELRHGDKGILQFYLEYFRVSRARAVISLLGVLAGWTMVDLDAGCACGSSKTYRRCHAWHVSELRGAASENHFKSELVALLCLIRPAEYTADHCLSYVRTVR
jgi:hypothetical protein